MKPRKNIKYFISYKGLDDYDSYYGIAKCKGTRHKKEKYWYQFITEDGKECWFHKDDIVGELAKV